GPPQRHAVDLDVPVRADAPVVAVAGTGEVRKQLLVAAAAVVEAARSTSAAVHVLQVESIAPAESSAPSSSVTGRMATSLAAVVTPFAGVPRTVGVDFSDQ